MEKGNLSKELWQTANLITAFAVVQTVAFTYACAGPGFADMINAFWTKMAIAIHLIVLSAAEIYAVWWCADRAAFLLGDRPSCDDTETANYEIVEKIMHRVAWGRIVIILVLLVPSLLTLYARQLGGTPFND